MKKWLPIMAALALTAASVMGCSGNKGGGSGTETPALSSAAQSTEETAAVDEKQEEPATSETAKDGYVLRVGSLKGPTSMGLVYLMDQAAGEKAEGSYEFTMVTAADELLAKIVNGDLDIALVPANMASIIFNKTNHGVNVLNINTLGVLYIVTGDESVTEFSDLKGKTVYLTGKGTTPDYVFQYLLKANGMSAEDVTLEYKSEATEVAALLKSQPDAVGLLPQPFATVAIAQNQQLNLALDLTREWEKVQKEEGGSLVTGVTICRGDLFAEHADAVETFLQEHKSSAAYAVDHVPETAELVAKAGIIEKAAIAEKALPYCSITYIDGEDMKEKLHGYLSVLFDMDPSTVGGTLPTKDFYYLP